MDQLLNIQQLFPLHHTGEIDLKYVCHVHDIEEYIGEFEFFLISNRLTVSRKFDSLTKCSS